jgi:hypothetical protein
MESCPHTLTDRNAMLEKVMVEKHTLPPIPKRLIEGLRDTGYDFDTALADIVDNSVDAGATRIDIGVDIDAEGDVIVSVADNGCGMNRDELLNAMTYGADVVNKAPNRLGKFGLGLKTASTAFCRRLSVVSRGAKEAEPVKATWDLDHVDRANQWELLLESPSKAELQQLDRTANGGTGTLVLWETVDRLLPEYDNPAGAPARKAVKRIRDQFQEHAGMVYQRFLDEGDTRARNVAMFINGQSIHPWNPFFPDVPGTDLVAQETIKVDIGGGDEAEFTIRAYVLPRREQFPSEDAARDAKLANQMQGIYIYRENRLIHPHDWLGMFSKEPHLTLLRVEFSFDHLLDSAFHVDIKKSRILLNNELYNWVKDKFIPAPRNAANERYRKGERKKAQDKAENAHADSNANIRTKEDDLRTADVKVLNEATNEVEIHNKKGTIRLKLLLSLPGEPGQFNVKPVPSLDDNILWSPTLIEGHHAVQINTGHPYYHKVYVPNLASGVTIQGMDSLLWALAEAELGTISEATRKHFGELRFEVSRILRALVEDLPDPELDAKDVE